MIKKRVWKGFVIIPATLCAITAAHAAVVPEGRYVIKALHSDLCLEAQGTDQVKQRGCMDGAAQQQFDISSAGSGYTKILSTDTGNALDVSSQSSADGAAIATWPYWGYSNQKFLALRNGTGYLLKASHSGKCVDIAAYSADDGGAAQQKTCSGASNQTYRLIPVSTDSANIPEGRYTLHAAHSNLCLDVPSSSPSNYVQLQQWTCHGGSNQQFDLSYAGNGRYEVRATHSGKCVDLNGGWTHEGNEVQQYSCNGSNAQRWKIDGHTDGSVLFKSALDTNKIWDVIDASTAPGAKVQIWSLNSSAPNKHWRMEPVSASANLTDGDYTLRNLKSSKCLDVPSSSTNPGIQLQQYTCNGTTAQRFTLTHITDGYYRVTNVNSDLALHVEHFISTENGAKIQQEEAHAGDNQLFRIESYGSGYRLRPKHSNMCIEPRGGSSLNGWNGATLQQYACDGGNAQSFALENGPQLPSPPTESVNNDYPIVLVHGFLGWGRDEMFGLKYWGGGLGSGGSRDLQEVLKANGHTTYTAAVGPFSSIRDRATELFYQIKGGCVDYGPYHSTHLLKLDGTPDSRTLIRKLDGGTAPDSTQRPRKCWASDPANNPNNDPLALYPQWGTPDPVTGKIRKIHLIGHSLGAPTIRALVHMLREGMPEETATDTALWDESVQTNPYTGGKNWVASLTSVTGGQQGISLGAIPPADFLFKLTNGAVQATAVGAGLTGSPNPVYDLKLEQWGIQRSPGESFSAYFERTRNSPIFSESRNTATWEVAPDGGIKDWNARIRTYGDIYYYSYAAQSTWRGWLTGRHYPILATNLIMQPVSLIVGSYTANEPGKTVIDSSYWPNDGVLNTRSQREPEGAPWRDFDGTSLAGTWNYMGILQGWDHADATGLLSEKSAHAINTLYLDQAKRLHALDN